MERGLTLIGQWQTCHRNAVEKYDRKKIPFSSSVVRRPIALMDKPLLL